MLPELFDKIDYFLSNPPPKIENFLKLGPELRKLDFLKADNPVLDEILPREFKLGIYVKRRFYVAFHSVFVYPYLGKALTALVLDITLSRFLFIGA